MLRYGLAAALTPDHVMQFAEALPDTQVVGQADALIVDAAMLRRAGAAVDVKAVEAWQLPTLWLEDRESATLSNRRDWATLVLPVLREQLLKALFDCLNLPSGGVAVAPVVATAPKQAPAKTAVAPVEIEANVIDLIELVEVVGDESGRDGNSSK